MCRKKWIAPWSIYRCFTLLTFNGQICIQGIYNGGNSLKGKASFFSFGFPKGFFYEIVSNQNG